jgi:hypothetical protein
VGHSRAVSSRYLKIMGVKITLAFIEQRTAPLVISLLLGFHLRGSAGEEKRKALQLRKLSKKH